MSKAKLKQVTGNVDNYLNTLKPKALAKMRTDQLYSTLFRDIGAIVIKDYEDTDVTRNTELQVYMENSQFGLKISVTGYVKVDDGFIQIEKTYYSEGYKDESAMEDAELQDTILQEVRSPCYTFKYERR